MTEYYPQFFTATILEWNNLLEEDLYKNIITDSLEYLVNNQRVAVYGFVIMPNHIHLIWHMAENNKRQDVQRDFMKYTAQMIKFDLIAHHPLTLEKFKVESKDRKYQIWERNPLTIDLWTEKVLLQKLNYIHENPKTPRWNLCKEAHEYKYSSASFYETGKSQWKFLSHYLG